MDRAQHLVMEDEHMDKLYASSNPLVRWFFNLRLRTMARMLPPKSLKILDVGCGEGHLIECFSSMRGGDEFHGLDILDNTLAQAALRCPSATFARGDACAMPFADATFDAVMCTDVIEHIHEYKLALAEMKRVLKPGGWLIINVPNDTTWTMVRFFLGRRPVRVPDHVNRFTAKSLQADVGWPKSAQKNLPFSLPFALALCTAVKFEKPN